MIPQSIIDTASKIVRLSTTLLGAAHSTSRTTIRELVRSMNSYYSNRIEGQGTHPLNIEHALKQNFSDQPDVSKLQRIALAHIEAERELELRVFDGESPMSIAFLVSAHHALYSRLSESDRLTADDLNIEPGKIRTKNVQVGRHIPPVAESLPKFHAKLDAIFNHKRAWETVLIHTACMHHRTAWVHPFEDGNGRAIRLQSHCALWTLSDGLWSPERGLARDTETYYAKLVNADADCRSSFDGRGKLTKAGLIEWIEYFLELCLDQVSFMKNQLELDGMKLRIQALIIFRQAHNKAIRQEAILPLYHLFAAGPLTRKEFFQMTGLGERTARTLLSSLLHEGLIVSDSAYGSVRWALPLNSLQFLFPELYPEAATKN